MFSKSLFKQSCKANGTMWTIITVAVCFMLACVMTIAGGSNLSQTKDAIQNTIIKDELDAQISSRSLNYFTLGVEGLEHFDNKFIEESTRLQDTDEARKAGEEAAKKATEEGLSPLEAMAKAIQAVTTYVSVNAYKNSVEDYMVYADKVATDRGFELDSVQALEIKGILFQILNPMVQENVYMFDNIYIDNNEEPARYDLEKLISQTPEQRSIYRQEYSAKNSVIVLAANMIKEENVNLILNELSNYGVTFEDYKEFGYTDYAKVNDVAATTLVDFRANLAYRLDNIKEGETIESIVNELTKECTKSLLASLPEEVSIALDEIGQADLYGTLVGSIFFKMAGLLLPIIYMIMTSNNLIAGQVDSGSMAYILSTGTKRRTVIFTQALYLVGSLFAMFACTTITSVICLACVDVATDLTYGKLLLINLGAFIVMFAMSGICFLTSCWFNRSKRSMAIGGGLNMFFLVATMLGLFGSPVLPSIVRMDALNAFNYVSIISLFDVVNILEGGMMFLWKLGILLALGIVCYAIGGTKFVKKDLPL